MTLILDTPGAEDSPERIFLANLPTIDALVQMVARRQRMSRADAEEFASIVRLRLIEDDYAVIRKFRGGSSLRTYLAVVIARVGLDYLDACWGRWRPSQGARRLGPTAMALEKLMVRDGLPFEEAWSALPAIEDADETERDRLHRFAERLRPRVRRCWLTLDDVEEYQTEPADPGPERLQDDRYLAAALARALRTLAPADFRLLKLRFANGLSISTIARREGLDQASLYRRVAALLRRLRRELEHRGIVAAH